MSTPANGKRRSRDGCPQCKKRHFRCDESRPECSQCIKRGIRCSGYVKQLRWSFKHLDGTSTSRKRKATCDRPPSPGSDVTPVQGLSADHLNDIPPWDHACLGDGSDAFDNTQVEQSKCSKSHALLTTPGKSNTDESAVTSSLDSPAGYNCGNKHTTRLPRQTDLHRVDDAEVCGDELFADSQTTKSYPYLEDLDSHPSQAGSLATFELFDSISTLGSTQEIQDFWRHLNAQEDPPLLSPKLIFNGSPGATANRYIDLPIQRADDSGNDASKDIPRDTLNETHTSLLNESLYFAQNETSTSSLGSFGPPQLPQRLSFNTASLLNHYFSAVCRINSCFDSFKNPFRTLVSEGFSSSELIYNCALSMSGAHLSCLNPGMKIIALNHQTRAISCLKRAVTTKEHKAGQPSPIPLGDLEELVIGVIMIGMSSPWHDPSSVGAHHLQGGRILFRKWLDGSKGGPPSWDAEGSTIKRRSFLMGAMSYWEMLSSFVVDQRLENFDYLQAVRDTFDGDATGIIYPNPWAGICTPLFITLAKLGCLLRQNRLIRCIRVIKGAESAQEKLLESLLQDLQVLEKEILNYTIPPDDMVEDTADPGTTKQTLRLVAHIYQLTGLLELYTQVPEVFERSTQAPVVDKRGNHRGKELADDVESQLYHFGFRLAISILALVSSVPIASAANVILMVPLLSAGSRLQPFFNQSACSDDRMKFHDTPLADSFVTLETHRAIDDHWRLFVRARIDRIYSIVRLDSVKQGARLMEIVWEIADARNEPMLSQPRKPMYWMDVMSEKQLETLLG